MILTVTLNPCVDHTLFVKDVKLNDTNRATRVERDAGGKGVNVSRVVHGLGGETLATGFLGGGAGAYVRETLQREGVEQDFVRVAEETRLNFSVESEDGMPPTCFNEPGPRITATELESLFDTVRRHLPSVSWLLLGGSRPGGLGDDIFHRLGVLATEAGVRLALDADGVVLRHGLAAKPSFLKPNSTEASRLLGWPVISDEDCARAAREIAELAGGAETVIISRGAQGAVMYAEGQVWIGRSPKVQCRSTVGSGDSMVAAMLTYLSRGRSAAEALRFGLAAGAATAEREGSGLATTLEVERLVAAATVEPWKC